MVAPKKGDSNPTESIILRQIISDAAHALPTSRVEDPDLALIVGLWDRLADECKRRLIEIVRANPPSHVDEDEFDEIDERGG
jgi:hypothetical protein